ncbi:MAG: hypothetical protein JXR91_17590 [Deltaproteobacteria bacterium]|nr:hypothetical protein [Deltaproteobacteria bacterium]
MSTFKYRLVLSLLFVCSLSACSKKSEGIKPVELDSSDACVDCNMSGIWIGTYSGKNYTDGGFIVQITQEKASLGGTIDLPILGFSKDKTEIAGTIDGNNISFGDIEQTITFSGQTGTNAASGTYDVPSYSESGVWYINRVVRGVFTKLECIATDDWNRGLTFDGTFFWDVQDGGIAKIDVNGNIISSIPCPENDCYISAKLASDGETIWYSAEQYVSDDLFSFVYQMDSGTGKILNQFSVGDAYQEINGIVWVDNQLWIAENGNIISIYTSNGKLVKEMVFPVNFNSLAYDGQLIWGSSMGDLYSFKKDGTPVGYYDLLTGGDCEDMTFQDAKLWCSNGSGMGFCLMKSKKDEVTILTTPNVLTTEETVQFTAVINGTFTSDVKWSVVEGDECGIITEDGYYTAPKLVPADACHILATSGSNPSQTDEVTINILSLEGISVTVAPQTVTLGEGETAQFSATVEGGTNKDVRWRMKEGTDDWCGTISDTGLFEASAEIIYEKVECEIEAVSQADNSAIGSAIITVYPIQIVVSPTEIMLDFNETYQFNVSVLGTDKEVDVVWSVFQQNCGTVDQTGLYTAPAEFTDLFCWVNATSVNNSTNSGTGTVTFINSPF